MMTREQAEQLEQEVVALRITLSAEQNESTRLRTQLEACEQDYDAACHLAESTSREWQLTKRRVTQLEEALSECKCKLFSCEWTTKRGEARDEA